MNVSEILKNYDDARRSQTLRPVKVNSLFTLEFELMNGWVDWQSWGDTSSKKNIHTLLQEVSDGEATFWRDPEGKLIRKVSKVVIDVKYRDDNGVSQRLFEEVYDEEKEDWVKRRIDPSKKGLREKVKAGESSLNAALRGLKEEMHITDLTEEELIGLVHLNVDASQRFYQDESNSYRGLLSNYQLDFFIFELPPSRYEEAYEFPEGESMRRLIWQEAA
ncbi:MAG: hypothetical protein WEC80_01635 [Patescibacteria group bacterium]